MSSANGYTFVDDSEMSVCEKIKKYFEKKTAEVPIYVNDSLSDSDSTLDSFSRLDESFVEVLKSNTHVTLIRNSKKEKETTMNADKVSNSDCQSSTTEPQNAPRTILKSDDSFVYDGVDLWNLVSDESFLETERQCQSPIDNATSKLEENDTTLLFDIEEPTFFNESSVFESSHLMLSPMKQVAMRRPSTIIEESTIRSINSSGEYSGIGSSLSLKQSVKQVAEQSTKSHSYRPSLVNVFPAKSRIGFYDTDKSSTEPTPKRNMPGRKDSLNLISFGESVDESSLTESTPKRTVHGKENSVCLISLIDSVDDVSSSNLSVDQSQNDSSLMDTAPPDQFNDTLEAVDYYMMQGKKIMDKTACSTSILQPQITFSPRNHSNSLLKKALARRHLMSINSSKSDNILERKLF